MGILAFETSAKAASVALLEGGNLLAESYQNAGLTHSRTILVMAEHLLQSCELTPQDVEAVAVAMGPGSFTGVRSGMAAAKGFAWGRELPLFGVSTLEAMAWGLGELEGLICPVMDARRSQVYNALFRASGGTLTRLRQDRAISMTDLEADLQSLAEPVTLVGDGALLCSGSMALPAGRLLLAPEHRRQQRASGVALAAWAAMQRDEISDANSLQPNYLRLSQAERERLERLQAAERKDNE